ncbi:hypothetical protein TNCV_1093641 [Trichonephila clavipes]|nr:hypothetical protein TNCV_1093641 [Trichonephila clavipes]
MRSEDLNGRSIRRISDNFLESETFRRMDLPVRSKEVTYIEHGWGCKTQTPSENHPRPKSRIAEKVGFIPAVTHIFSYFRYKIAVRILFI